MIYMCPRCREFFARPREVNVQKKTVVKCPFCNKREPFIIVRDADEE